MNFEDVQKLVNAAKSKISLLNNNFGKYFIRSVMAGIFVTIAVIFCNVMGNVFASTQPQWGKLLGAFVFSIAVCLLSMIGGELFTGNNMVMAFGAFGKDVTWGDAGKVWAVSWVGNLVGSILFGLLFVGAGASGTADYFAGFIGNKLAIPTGQLFLRGVLCNFFVCLGVLCGIKLKSEAAKIMMICFCVTAFVLSGFEHSVGNMGIYTIAYALVPGLSLGAIAKALVIVTLGNMVGGALLLAWPLRKMSADK